ncbi:related to transport Sec39 [Lecanosticta acicola]|uniref:Related to transport Sec39 n=1 Tax=Lecanosticta acicola TaxID=111012 RepID=A0AAI9EBI3_9PEZI|nr:related to transport Sec39 [Lecanosticta acicola]
MDAAELSPAQCVLLTVHLACEANIKALHSFTPTRLDALDPELVLRILLTHLPEAVDPHEYTNYVEEVASRLYVNFERVDVEVNVAPVKDISDEQAQKRVKKLHLLEIAAPSFPSGAPNDLLTRFLCHRAYRIDAQTGLLSLVPALIEPFLDRNDYIRTWYISVVLPLLRLEIEYYPEVEALAISLADFEQVSGREGVDLLLRKAAEGDKSKNDATKSVRSSLGRDIKSLVGPWMYGHTERKQRRSERDSDLGNHKRNVENVAHRIRKIGLAGLTEDDKTGHDWEHLYRWMVKQSTDRFTLVADAIEEWDGPSDVDLGGFEHHGIQYLDEDLLRKLEAQYAQAAFASCYSAQTDSQETVRAAHGILARLAELLDFIPPPDLATSVDSLPRIERHATKLDESQTVADLTPDALLRPEHPLTTPRMETYMLLQMMVYSAYQFAGLGYPLSLVNVAKLHFYANAEEQLDVFRRIMHHLSKTGTRKDENQWISDRAKLLWLWNWGIESDPESPDEGSGTLGKIRRQDFEQEMLKVFVETSCYQLAIRIFVSGCAQSALASIPAERIILEQVMEAYDSASNGNRTRGGIKKANDIVSAFKPHFPDSVGFKQAAALIAATHALSFYSLTLQHGVPFQPVSIRVSHDPLSLISKLLEQNPRSYTKLDDLIDIARNLVSAGLACENEDDAGGRDANAQAERLARWRKDAERRVTFMAVEASLREDDFETAYSYIVSRLTPAGSDIQVSKEQQSERRKSTERGHTKRSSRTKTDMHDDDISWRAAFLAGRYRPSTDSPTLRRLEQRTELLSLALLLAPVSALTEILAAWRRCEDEMTVLERSQQQAEKEFDDRADKRLSGSSALPGNFTVSGEQPELILNQKRREMGRMGAATRGNDDTPLSMFDLTRSAAKMFSQNAFPLRGAAARSSGEQERSTSMQDSTGSLDRPNSPGGGEGQQRVRKRDYVANVAANSLASGLGWVLGATPASQQEQQSRQDR